jgi:iron(III) transport system permease protein
MHALAWMSVADRRQVLDQIGAFIFGPGLETFSVYGFLPSVFVLVLAFMPLVILIAFSGLEAIDSALVEEALVLQPGWVVARRILVPLAAPSILAGAGLVFVLALVEYGVPSALQYNVYSMEIYAHFSQDAEPVRAAASAIGLVLPGAVVLAASLSPIGAVALRGRTRRTADLGVDRWPALARLVLLAGVAVTGLASVGTVAVLIARTGDVGVFVQSIGMASAEILLSVQVAVASATVASLLILPLASAYTSRSDSGPLWLLLALPLAVPSALTGIALISLTNGPWLDWARETPLVLVLAHVARLLPFAAFAAVTQVRRVDPSLVEAAALHDVGFWWRFWRVRLPLLVPALALAWLVVFVFSLGELGVSLLVVPPGQATLPIRVYNLMHYGATDIVAALSLVALGLAAAGVALFGALRRKLWA